MRARDGNELPAAAARTGAAAGHQGHYHEALCYQSNEELVTALASFVRAGVAANEPTVVALDARHTELVKAVLPASDVARIVFRDGAGLYARPAVVLETYRRMLTTYTAAGASQIRLVGEVPTRAQQATWDWWARYEATVNHAFDQFPLWSVCAYDTRTSPPAVLADVLATHPRLVTLDQQHVGNDRYVPPVVFLEQRHSWVPDPLQGTAPAIEWVDPSAATVRAGLARLCAVINLGLPVTAVEDMMLAVTEVVSNALVYGQPPVTVRVWHGMDRIVITVHDRGFGPQDPYVGLLPAAHAPIGGAGLWFAYQTVDHASLYRDADGFTVRLVIGEPHGPTYL